MTRQHIITQGLSKDQKGIEVAPWFSPLTPKRDGYNCLVLDVFDQETLLARAKADPLVPPEAVSKIETVDLVGNANDIAELVSEQQPLGTFDYIVSSHNFEHLPDPIKFLQGCHKVLRTGGVLSMAIPDYRACMDIFRPRTIFTEWLDAYQEARRKPSPGQVLACHSYMTFLRDAEARQPVARLSDAPDDMELIGDFNELFSGYIKAKRDTGETYVDAHCSVLSPKSFELLVTECRQVGLPNYNIVSIEGPVGCEFFVKLEAGTPEAFGPLPASEFQQLRIRLLREILADDAKVHTDRDLPKLEKSLLRLPFVAQLRAAKRKLKRLLHRPLNDR